ncbi:ATP-binding protein [Nodularia harveyana UHCC-0300]|uniref:histidine kinase n=1 Tax=Nodularia harveyana UHCC-0300 TaxID=2974287 RepID=A0ABU5UDC1_9CYAN|nr:ATP-binding protein [Nodularia harveyana]MEA5580426.1 ATP-binding protein [Nodularia harveyana UHCC-0300]
MVQPLTVLIVDDSPEDRLAYRRYLLQDQEYSYKILEEESGEGALTLCRQFQPDAILLDFLLPDLDGLEFIAQLKQQSEHHIPAVIMLTGYGNETVAVLAMKSGVQDYLVKGQTTGERLRSTIRSAIKNIHLSRELQRSEERYRYLSNAIPQMVWIANINGEYEYVNQRWCEFTGQSIEMGMGMGWTKVIHPDDIQIVIDAWMQSLQTGEPYEQELRYRKFDGGYRWHLARAVPMKNEQGNIIKWFGSSTNIDHRKHLEAERDRLLHMEQIARETAETANKSKDEFVAMVSHDLRSPLNAILGWAKLLRTRKLDPDTIRNALETIERNAESQAKLLEDLLNMSRILRGKLQLEVYPVNLVSIIKEAVETAYPSADVQDIDLECIIEEPIPPIMGDAYRLLQVLGNLLSNAIKFTPPSGKVKVQLAKIDQSSVLIQVSDTGIGIDPEFLPYVFERYRQADFTKKKSGLGLGLAIARHLVELHGGTIAAHSPGKGLGTTFTIKLPCK